jgi:hypothetical protein
LSAAARHSLKDETGRRDGRAGFSTARGWGAEVVGNDACL